MVQPTRAQAPVLVLGAAYAGKSVLAARMLLPDRPAVVLGTGELEDPTFVRRVMRLKELRPDVWKTVEPVRDLPAALADALAEVDQVLVDSFSQWLAAQCVEGADEERLAQYVGQIETAIRGAPKARVVIVSAEAGAGPAPSRPLERLYRRALGDANQRLAALSATVIEVTVGIPRQLKP